MNLFRSLGGSVHCQLTSADPAAAVTALNNKGIMLSDVSLSGDLTVCFSCAVRDLKSVEKITQSRGEQLRLTRRVGIFWKLFALKKRKLLLIGCLILLLFMIFVPSRVFFIRVEGNHSVPTRLILAKAEECGIRFGAGRRQIRSEQVKNALLATIPELSWTGVNTSGCVATISVREKNPEDTTAQRNGVGSIVALRDGVIHSVTVTKGNGLCRPGEAVKAGQTLISGYTDCGLSIRATLAEGEVFAKTVHHLSAVTPSECTVRRGKTGEIKKYALLIGKKRINFYKDSGILDISCDKMTETEYLTLPGGFELPIGIEVQHISYFDLDSASLEEGEVQALLNSFTERYLLEQMTAGSVLQAVTDFQSEYQSYMLQGTYYCLEMIGQLRSEEIIE